MRNYIILNGNNSSNLKGLLISKLPPISKPLMRTNIEEIDGRDGDIITNLGYGAYNKTIEVGLSYNYDINAIIEYFNSEGIVTFSNEPDKYYYYKIKDQIDFEKLLRFKQAKVTFHIQPFKYLVNEPIKTYVSPINNDYIVNKGNIYSKPTLKIYGSGDIGIYLNNIQVFQITLGNEEYITIDTAQMEAYKDTLNNLKNRLVIGDYENFKLNIGTNIIKASGNVTSIEITNYCRWL